MPINNLRGLYAITDSQLLADGKLLPYVEAALQGGARLLQYRDKSGDTARRLDEAQALQDLCARYDASLIINDDAELAARLPRNMPGFAHVPDSRWLDEAVKHYTQTPDGLQITYDPALRDAFLAAFEGPPVDLWPLWDATAGLPVALIRGANSDLLSQACTDEMRRRRPDMIFASVPDRAHIPFLDEPESLAALRAFVTAVEGAAP